ncbi:hypothetical protein H5P28_18590 [Ruficoccus amylovorans]|uniref:Core-binding (CB) domain-containing protein n=1 Tax=Ruficoccus amylovorans TaxID=1804625 RepID=A0A842HJI3_9BACT|nr:hypothetical protein [Ruficoccus amylovorans]MBC2596280.1 hypothetical protein [Ruficoccus amylovorans]
MNGKRIRQNFKDRSHAVAERQRLDVRALNEEPEGKTIWTTLSQKENQDAIAALSLLKKSGSKRSLTFATDYFLKHFKETAIIKKANEAASEYYDEKSKERNRGALSFGQEQAIRFEMNKFSRYFEGRQVSSIDSAELKTYLETTTEGKSSSGPSLKTWNNRRGYLNTFFEYCLNQGFAADNPIAKVQQYKIQKSRGTAETLSAQEAEALMHWLEDYRGEQNKNGQWWNKPGCMVPYFALTLFAGIRPDWRNGEISKLGLKDIRQDTGVILIEPEVSKNNEKRTIKLQPNLQLWLKKYPVSEYPIVRTKRFDDMSAQVRQRFSLTHDVLRHTYISMTVGAFRSVGDTALQAGNSESIIRKHYLDLKSEVEADAFWHIIPKGMSLPPRMKKQDGRYIEEHK